MSRANLIQGLAARRGAVAPARSLDDRFIRAEVMRVLDREGWVRRGR